MPQMFPPGQMIWTIVSHHMLVNSETMHTALEIHCIYIPDAMFDAMKEFYLHLSCIFRRTSVALPNYVFMLSFLALLSNVRNSIASVV